MCIVELSSNLLGLCSNFYFCFLDLEKAFPWSEGWMKFSNRFIRQKQRHVMWGRISHLSLAECAWLQHSLPRRRSEMMFCHNRQLLNLTSASTQEQPQTRARQMLCMLIARTNFLLAICRLLAPGSCNILWFNILAVYLFLTCFFLPTWNLSKLQLALNRTIQNGLTMSITNSKVRRSEAKDGPPPEFYYLPLSIIHLEQDIMPGWPSPGIFIDFTVCPEEK